ncbi:MAG: V-type ATPase 116kDa subunit family protein, partial [Candidatus Bathyarchaeia archaeon]
MLWPDRMSRIEVVTPTDRVEEVVRTLGKLEIAHFIDINAVKEYKYKDVSSEIGRTPREDTLQQLSSRLGNIMRKLGEIPYPEPLPVKEDPQEVFPEVEKNLARLEVDVARLENALKEVSEERASLEREATRFQEEYENAQRLLVDYGVNLNKLMTFPRNTEEARNHLRTLYAGLLEMQRTLPSVDAAAKLVTPLQTLPNDPTELHRIAETLKLAKDSHTRIAGAISQRIDAVGKLDDIINEIISVVDRKIEANERLDTLKAEAPRLKDAARQGLVSLPKEALAILPPGFAAAVERAAAFMDGIAGLEFASPRVEEIGRELSKITYDVMRASEVLEYAERFRTLSAVKELLNGVRSGGIGEVSPLLQRAEELSKSGEMRSLSILERVIRLLHYEQRLNELAQKASEVQVNLETLGKSSATIHAFREIVDIELRIEDIKRKFRQTGKTAAFEVWVRKAEVGKAVETVKATCPSAVVHAPAGFEKGDKPPTAMRVPRIIKPVEELIKAIGLPNYRELNPTFITVITFPIIFGMMFADIGQGLVVLIGGLLVRPVFKRLKLSGPLWSPLVTGRPLVILMGISAIVFGFLFGDFFGATTVKAIAESANKEVFPLYTAVTGLHDAFWFAVLEPETHNVLGTTVGPLILLKIAIIVGTIQMLMGMVINIMNRLAVRDYKHTVSCTSRIWFQSSISFVIISPTVTISSLVTDMNSLLMFIFAPLIGMIIAHRFSSGSFFEGAIEGIEGFIMHVSQTASYARILALAMVHAVFNMIALMGSGPLFWPLFLIANIFMLISLNGVLAFGHTLRLHWVE